MTSNMMKNIVSSLDAACICGIGISVSISNSECPACGFFP